MRTELKGLSSPDIFDLELFKPENENIFCFYLEISVGIKNKQGSEQFGITVCTPQWLIENNKVDDVIFGKNYILVFKYNYQRIHDKIKRYIDGLEGSDWESLALKVSRIGHWEFEDYQNN